MVELKKNGVALRDKEVRCKMQGNLFRLVVGAATLHRAEAWR